MNEKQKEILQKKFADVGLESNEAETLLILASDVCRYTAEMLQETEPNAMYSINNLKEATEVLSALATN